MLRPDFWRSFFAIGCHLVCWVACMEPELWPVAPFATPGEHLLPINGLWAKCSPLQEAACGSLEKMTAGGAVCMHRVGIVAGALFLLQWGDWGEQRRPDSVPDLNDNGYLLAGDKPGLSFSRVSAPAAGMQDDVVVTALCWAQLNTTCRRCLQGRKAEAAFSVAGSSHPGI